jgi:hypothetical protein
MRGFDSSFSPFRLASVPLRSGGTSTPEMTPEIELITSDDQLLSTSDDAVLIASEA